MTGSETGGGTGTTVVGCVRASAVVGVDVVLGVKREVIACEMCTTGAGAGAGAGAASEPDAAYAMPPNAATPAASPATGSTTRRRNNSRWSARASSRVQPSALAMRRSRSSASRPSAAAIAVMSDAAQVDRLTGPGAAHTPDETRVRGDHVV